MEEEMMMSKAEIDTTAPFRSVKEAVMLFGESVVLGTQVYGKEMQNGTTMVEYKKEIGRSDEVEEAKQTLRRAREENIQMATSIYFLQQELDQTKIELQQLKAHDHESNRIEQPQQKIDFQKKKYVSFADPPCVEQVVLLNPRDSTTEPVLRRQASLRKKKMKELLPLIKRIFLRKRETSQVSFA